MPENSVITTSRKYSISTKWCFSSLFVNAVQFLQANSSIVWIKPQHCQDIHHKAVFQVICDCFISLSSNLTLKQQHLNEPVALAV
jgi:hypothetical protein